ncbi:hypothetical protein [Thalassotalea sp. PLHSN55]|uniref:hypothetical protein n=1 Tax=Thalassotalea sp. PLHSN55 TaxID=3435888 RepID=UPI003F846EFA
MIKVTDSVKFLKVKLAAKAGIETTFNKQKAQTITRHEKNKQTENGEIIAGKGTLFKNKKVIMMTQTSS